LHQWNFQSETNLGAFVKTNLSRQAARQKSSSIATPGFLEAGCTMDEPVVGRGTETS
jgi:hypothetical protein